MSVVVLETPVVLYLNLAEVANGLIWYLLFAIGCKYVLVQHVFGTVYFILFLSVFEHFVHLFKYVNAILTVVDDKNIVVAPERLAQFFHVGRLKVNQVELHNLPVLKFTQIRVDVNIVRLVQQDRETATLFY